MPQRPAIATAKTQHQAEEPGKKKKKNRKVKLQVCPEEDDEGGVCTQASYDLPEPAADWLKATLQVVKQAAEEYGREVVDVVKNPDQWSWTGFLKAAYNVVEVKQNRESLKAQVDVFQGLLKAFIEFLAATEKWQAASKVKICVLDWGQEIAKAGTDFLVENFGKAKVGDKTPLPEKADLWTKAKWIWEKTWDLKVEYFAAMSSSDIEAVRQALPPLMIQISTAYGFILNTKRDIEGRLETVRKLKAASKTAEAAAVEKTIPAASQKCSLLLKLDEKEMETEATATAKKKGGLRRSQRQKAKAK